MPRRHATRAGDLRWDLIGIGAVIGVGIAFWTTDYLNMYVHSGDQNTRIPSWMTSV